MNVAAHHDCSMHPGFTCWGWTAYLLELGDRLAGRTVD